MTQALKVEECDWCATKDNVLWYCENCDEKLCDCCKIVHLKARKTKNDNIIPLNQARNVGKAAFVLCSDHITKETEFYCNQCDRPICAICYHNNHLHHKCTLLDEFANSKRKDLQQVQERLASAEPASQEALVIEELRHTSLKFSGEEMNETINLQEIEAIEKISALCNELLKNVNAFVEDENKRHEGECHKIQSHSTKIDAALLSLQSAMDSGDPVQMMQQEKNAAQTLDEIKDYRAPTLTIPRFQPASITEQDIIDVIGTFETNQYNKTDGTELSKSNIQCNEPQNRDENLKANNEAADQGARTKQTRQSEGQPKHHVKQSIEDEDISNEVRAHNKRELQNPNDDKQDLEIDVTKVRVKSVIEVKSQSVIIPSIFKFAMKEQVKSKSISSIVPVSNDRMWVRERGDTDLTLINRHGEVIKKSVSVNEGEFIIDVKLYNSNLMVICYKGQKVIRMSSDGTNTSTFSNLTPYYTCGLCIGYSDDMLVICAKYTPDRRMLPRSSLVVRLDKSGNVVQTIQKDNKSARLFTKPYKLTSLPSGDAMVTDTFKVIAVDREGGHLFTWDGEKEGVKGDRKNLHSITHDSQNHVFVTDCENDKVYVMGREGRGSKRLLDSKQGMSGPQGIAINHDGQLLVGCDGGKIHVVEYQY